MMLLSAISMHTHFPMYLASFPGRRSWKTYYVH